MHPLEMIARTIAGFFLCFMGIWLIDIAFNAIDLNAAQMGTAAVGAFLIQQGGAL